MTHPLGDMLHQLGWRPEDLARRLNESAAQQGWSARIHIKTPYKWLAGQQPRPPWRQLIQLLMGTELRRELAVADFGWQEPRPLPALATNALAQPWTTEGGLRAAQNVNEAVTMQRRTLFTGIASAAMTASAHEWLLATTRSDSPNSGRRNGPPLCPDVIDTLDAITGNLRRMDDHLGGGQTLALVQAHLKTVLDLLQRHRYSDTLGQRLHSTAAELLRLAGWLSFDSGRHPQAEWFWDAALREAHTAGDHALGANILGFWSCQAKDVGQISEAITLAETARAGYLHGSPRVSAILDLRAAEAYANDKAVTQCRRAIDDAFSHLRDTPSSHGEPDWCYWVNGAQAHAQAGYCFLKLEDWSRARLHLRHALQQQADERSREGALRDTLLATTYVRQRQPDIEQALYLGNRAVHTLSGQVQSPRCVTHVTNLLDCLAPYRRRPAVRDFTDHARALLAPPNLSAGT